MKCTNFGCQEEAGYFDKYHSEIALCWKHAAEYFEAFADWLWLGTPGALQSWLDTFGKSGGKLK